MTLSAVEHPKQLDRFPQEELTKQQQLHIDALHTIDPLVVSEAELNLATQLAHCASQHHSSEYNIVKFGPHGSPASYIPLSIQLPSYIKELRRRQYSLADQDPWWLAHPSSPSPHTRLRSPHLTPKRLPTPTSEDTEVELVIEESITSSSHVQSPKGGILELVEDAVPSEGPHSNDINAPTTSLKTSRTHPINISAIISHELLPIISAHLQPSEIHVPTVFDLPLWMRLDTLTMPYTRSYLTMFTDGSPPQFPESNGNHQDDAAAQLHQALIRPYPPPPLVIWNPKLPTSPLEAIESSLFPRAKPPNSTDTKHSVEMPLSPLSPPDSGLSNAEPQAFNVSPPNPPLPLACSPVAAASMLPIVQASYHQAGNIATKLSPRTSLNANILANPAPALLRFPPLILGNLLLSSCPGKKVRLKGPVKGRGAICRDLGIDLERIGSMGVRCIVCCLDDDELEFLGVEWADYAQFARQNGIDVLRVPMPEGLTPLALPPFNYALDQLIQGYTLRGIPVLVHCRGGVGRAGLVACCWMIKVGLCGWLEKQDVPSHQPPDTEMEDYISQDCVPIVPSQGPRGDPVSSTYNAPADICQPLSYRGRSDVATAPEPGTTLARVDPEILDLVQKAIAVVRRRRSVKAIETYEQVKFLVEFVEFLRVGASKEVSGTPMN